VAPVVPEYIVEPIVEEAGKPPVVVVVEGSIVVPVGAERGAALPEVRAEVVPGTNSLSTVVVLTIVSSTSLEENCY
jgi:hypothetical protein